MDRGRHSKRYNSSKSKKSSKKKRSRDENGSSLDNAVKSVSSSVIKPLVEYSDVSSEDLSEPEAGEIQSEESPSISDGELSANPLYRGHHRKTHSAITIDDDRDSYNRHSNRKTIVVAQSPNRRSVGNLRIVDSSLIAHSPTPHHERKHSLSSDVSRTSSMRFRKKHETSPTAAVPLRPAISSPTLESEEYDLRRHRKKKDKRHKREKKSAKKKKRKSKHRSRSSSYDNISDHSPKTSPPTKNVGLSDRETQLSDWEQPAPTNSYRSETVDQVDTVTCSPVSPPTSHTSPEPGLNRTDSPVSYSPPIPPQKKSTESPHTPLLPPKAYEHSKSDEAEFESGSYSGRKQLSPPIRHSLSISPGPVIRIDDRPRDTSWSRQSLSPIQSPFRNPSPDVQIIGRDSMSPSRKRRRVGSSHAKHGRHGRDKVRHKDRRRVSSRSRSPFRRHRPSTSPSWSRSRHYSRSPSRTRSSKKYRSRSPKRISSPSPRSPPSR